MLAALPIGRLFHLHQLVVIDSLKSAFMAHRVVLGLHFSRLLAPVFLRLAEPQNFGNGRLLTWKDCLQCRYVGGCPGRSASRG
jgi:hypothetical protein